MYSNPRFANQSKYVWRANKQSSQVASNATSTQTQAAAPQPSTVTRAPLKSPATQSTTQPTHTRIVSAVKKTPARTAVLHTAGISRRELSVLNVTALDTPNAVAVDIASKLKEDKFYVISELIGFYSTKMSCNLFLQI